MECLKVVWWCVLSGIMQWLTKLNYKPKWAEHWTGLQYNSVSKKSHVSLRKVDNQLELMSLHWQKLWIWSMCLYQILQVDDALITSYFILQQSCSNLDTQNATWLIKILLFTFFPCRVIWIKIPADGDNFDDQTVGAMPDHVHHLLVPDFDHILLVYLCQDGEQTHS